MNDITDKELLTLAAKAAGVEWQPSYYWTAETGLPLRWDEFSGQMVYWNPLTDDGDAFRLAVKLCIGLDHNRAGDQQRYVAADRPGCEGCFSPICAVEDEFDESQRAAATRLAIVRAAAEIGKAMP